MLRDVPRFAAGCQRIYAASNDRVLDGDWLSDCDERTLTNENGEEIGGRGRIHIHGVSK